MGQWCPHCVSHSSCGIYETRPGECRTFDCNWLINAAIGEEWKPIRSRMVLHHVNDGGFSKLVVHVDPGSPQAWRKEPYYSQLKRWARNLADQRGLLNLYIGKRVIVVLPNKDVDLGSFNLGDRIVYRQRRAGSDWEYEVEKVTQQES
jgi:hypothetical protein